MTLIGEKRNSKEYYVQVYGKDINGKIVYGFFPTGVPIPYNKGERAFKAAREAASVRGRQFEAEFRAQLLDTCVDHSNDTIAEYATYYLEDIWEDSKNSCHLQKSHLVNHIIPHIGHIKLKDLTPGHIERLLKKLREECDQRQLDIDTGIPNTPKPFYASIQKILVTLSAMLSHAVDRELIPRNVALSKKMYRDILKKLPQKEKAPTPTGDQITAILNAVRGSDIESIVVLMANYGLRREEALGLTWDDVTKDALLIRNTVIKTDTSPRVFRKDTTKSKSSRRDLPLNDYMRDYLFELRLSQQQDSQLFRTSYKGEGFVCARRDGTPLAPDFVTHKFAKILKANNLPEVSLEKLRNGVATMIFNEVLSSELVGMWLGHSPKNVTESHYIDRRLIRDSLRKISDFLQKISESRLSEY